MAVTATALYTHTCTLYEKLHKLSKMNEEKERIFTGNYSDVFKEVGASLAYYTPIRSLLLSPTLDPCITIYQRGNSDQPSQIRLNHPPPPEWSDLRAKDLTSASGSATLPLLEKKVAGLVAWRESIGEVNLSEALRNFEQRLSNIERELRKLGKTKTKAKE
jgi:hypothetical protein